MVRAYIPMESVLLIVRSHFVLIEKMQKNLLIR